MNPPLKGTMILSALLCLAFGHGGVSAAVASEVESGSIPKVEDELALGQSQLADKLARMETLMLRMAEFDAANNPRRSAVLKQALKLSKDKHIRLRMETVVDLLNQRRLTPAVKDQEGVRDDLNSLLELLQSENRPERLKSEQQRVREYIKELERILRQHRGVQGRTEGGDDAEKLARDQKRVADRAGRLGSKIDDNESKPTESSSSELDSNRPSGDDDSDSNGDESSQKNGPESGRRSDKDDSKSVEKDQQSNEVEKSKDERKKDDGKEKDEDDEDTENKSSDSSEGKNDKSDGDAQEKSGENANGQPSDGGQNQPSDQESQGTPQPGQGGQPGEQSSQDQQQQQQQDEDFPGRKRIAAAEEKMRQAQERLEKAQRQQAQEEQIEARRLLEEAKAELERILRQMREEEIERMLALLEARCRKMLELQLKVYQQTQRLDKTPVDRRDRQVDVQAGKLSLQERRVMMEADKALLILREEGSSAAFPEALLQMREDMEQVVDRLARTKIGPITQGLEEDIIAALEEMIEALQQAQQDQEERRQNQQQQQSQPGEPQDPSLVDSIAELKLIKALQLRVNKRTQGYARLLQDADDPAGQATDEELVSALMKLAGREQRIFRTTRDIVLGKNK